MSEDGPKILGKTGKDSKRPRNSPGEATEDWDTPAQPDSIDAPEPEPEAVEYDGFYGLSDMDAETRFRKWRSLVTMEDMMVAALMKRLMYEGEIITNSAAYNGLRDAMGHFIATVKVSNPKLAVEIDRRYSEKGDGSTDDKEKMPPAPNP